MLIMLRGGGGGRGGVRFRKMAQGEFAIRDASSVRVTGVAGVGNWGFTVRV